MNTSSVEYEPAASGIDVISEAGCALSVSSPSSPAIADLITELAPSGAGLPNELFTTSISFYRQVAVPAMDGLAVSEADPLPITHTGHPMALYIVEGTNGFRCDFDIAADVVHPDLIERIPQYYRNLLGVMVANGERPLAELDHDDNGVRS